LVTVIFHHQIVLQGGYLHGRTSRQVALNYLTRHHNVFTIPKTTHPERARENSGGTGWKLNEEDILAIELVFPVQESDTLQMI
jgi:diketogulonate reductase-like aldo/keto reductase